MTNVNEPEDNDLTEAESAEIREFLESIGFTVYSVGGISEEAAVEEEKTYESMTGHENPVHDYTVKLKFQSAASQAEVEEFIDELIEKVLPLGTEAIYETNPAILDVEDLTQRHIGASVEFSADNRVVKGKLEAIQAVGGRPHARALVVNGETWTLTYGIVTVS